jgi:hypothetical protein
MTSVPQSNLQSLLAKANVPAYCCPPGTKLFILNLGILQADEGWYALHVQPYEDC